MLQCTAVLSNFLNQPHFLTFSIRITTLLAVAAGVAELVAVAGFAVRRLRRQYKSLPAAAAAAFLRPASDLLWRSSLSTHRASKVKKKILFFQSPFGKGRIIYPILYIIEVCLQFF